MDDRMKALLNEARARASWLMKEWVSAHDAAVRENTFALKFVVGYFLRHRLILLMLIAVVAWAIWVGR